MKLEKWSLGYALTKPVVNVIHHIVNRKVVVKGLENLPKGDPIIFTPNHQNALLDALAVLLNVPYQPVWLARADIFNKKTKGILHFLKISPVYRMRDGMDNLHKNDEVFNQAIAVLENKRQLALFPEGTHSGKRQSLAHKKAVPRIAFMAAEKNDFKLNLQVVPVGIYYSHYNEFNRYLLLQIGKPIQVAKFKELYHENQNQAMMALRKEIYDSVVDLSIHIPSKSNYDAYEMLLKIMDKEVAAQSDRKLCKAMDKFKTDKEIISKVESIKEKDEERYALLMQNTNQYIAELKRNGISEEAVEKGALKGGETLLQLLKFLVLAPFAGLGKLLYYLPLTLPTQLIRKKIKDHVFWGTFEFVVSIILFYLFYAIYAGIAGGITHTWWAALGTLAVLPLLGKVAYFFSKSWKVFRQRQTFFSKAASKEVVLLRQAIREAFMR